MNSLLIQSILILFSSSLNVPNIWAINVQGPMFYNAVWDELQNPYILTGDVQIPKNYTLTIKAGTQILFNNNYQILVKGQIKIQGTDLKPINFVSNNGIRSMIMFKSTELSQTSIQYAHFFGPRTAIQLAEEKENNQDSVKNSGILRINNLALINSKIQTNGYETSASLLITDAFIVNSTIVGVYPRSESIILKNVHVESSYIESESYNSGIQIETSTLLNTKLALGCCGANIQISDTKMINTDVLEGSGSPVSGPFKMNRCTADGLSIQLPSAEVSLTSSLIRLSKEKTIHIGITNITCTTITGDRTQESVTITGYLGYYSSAIPQIISKSTISNSFIGLIVKGDKTNLIIDQTNFLGNDQYNIYTNTLNDIIADNNYWGAQYTTKTEAKIFDYESNIEYGRVIINSIQSFRIDNHFC